MLEPEYETDDKRDSRDAGMMRRAIELARTAAGKTRPNPLVGAIIERDGLILGAGYHERAGGGHAEARAVADARKNGHADLSGATAYVTLEPCCHVGRTGPCADLLISAGISRVVCGMTDPDPRVSGGGIARLRAAGIDVTNGVCEAECRALNGPFVKRVTEGLPYVTLKYAMSLDGKTATATGESRWISSEESRGETHRLRSESAAIVCGIGTVLADDPLLNARVTSDAHAPQPVRVVVDSTLKIPPDARVVSTARSQSTIIACALRDGEEATREKARALEEAGAEVLRLPGPDGRVDLVALFGELARRGLDSVLLEGGGTLSFSAIESGLVDRVIAYIAPTLIGGATAPSPVAGTGFPELRGAATLRDATVSRSGPDVRVEGYVCSRDS